MKADYRLPGRLFLSSVGPHSLQIFNKNDEYLMSGIEVIKTRDRAIIEKTIVQEWINMNDEQKNTIWFYLEKMLIIIMNIDDDIQDITAEQQAAQTLCNSFTSDGVIEMNSST